MRFPKKSFVLDLLAIEEFRVVDGVMEELLERLSHEKQVEPLRPRSGYL